MLLPHDTQIFDYAQIHEGQPERTVERRGYDRDFPIFKGLLVSLLLVFGTIALGHIVAGAL